MQTLLATLLLAATATAARNLTFPDGFLFGTVSASYQVEGAWNLSGKGENIWDRLIHTRPDCIADRDNADVAADSYHKYKEDVQLIKNIGFNYYRFSIAWPRILPKGDLSVINQAGIDYYNNLINELLANGIFPVVTIFHWDLPQYLQDLGGMMNSIIVDYFEDYARLLFTHFGDRVKWWITFNEPYTILYGYRSQCFAPGLLVCGVGEYLVIHNLLKAHARAYHLYDDEFRSTQKGKIGMALGTTMADPKTQSPADIEAAELYQQFTLNWMAHPVYSKKGDYPDIVKERVYNKSMAEGLRRSRLPKFSEYWVNYIRGTHDFYGMNYYSSNLVSAPNSTTNSSVISLENDMGNPVVGNDPSWIVGPNPDFAYSPKDMRKVLNWVWKNYDGVDILITENGWSDHGTLNDDMRVRYFANYMAGILDAIHLDNITVLGHSAWSIVDTFEWATGYTVRFGLHHVDFNSPNRTRVAKESTKYFADIIKNRTVPAKYLD
ncbi:myrosinase 1-like [Bacillus rossius redtenbacheri]|uniref:myrosinase 1-like n=1 Tax=Bacillus rossius redtenbacheri TaxID=93214 RepID=UPI002FDDC2A6